MVGPHSLIMALALDLCIMKIKPPNLRFLQREMKTRSALFSTPHCRDSGELARFQEFSRQIFFVFKEPSPRWNWALQLGFPITERAPSEVPKDCESLGWAKTP